MDGMIDLFWYMSALSFKWVDIGVQCLHFGTVKSSIELLRKQELASKNLNGGQMSLTNWKSETEREVFKVEERGHHSF